MLLFYWYSQGWDPGGSEWYFYAKRNPLTCAAGERVVAGVCEACPTHQVCSNGVTQPEQYCGSGNAPADAPCATSCPVRPAGGFGCHARPARRIGNVRPAVWFSGSIALQAARLQTLATKRFVLA